jgi:hypothetical protein
LLLGRWRFRVLPRDLGVCWTGQTWSGLDLSFGVFWRCGVLRLLDQAYCAMCCDWGYGKEFGYLGWFGVESQIVPRSESLFETV